MSERHRILICIVCESLGNEWYVTRNTLCIRMTHKLPQGVNSQGHDGQVEEAAATAAASYPRSGMCPATASSYQVTFLEHLSSDLPPGCDRFAELCLIGTFVQDNHTIDLHDDVTM